MKHNNHTKKIIFLAFLLSLLFHFSGIIYITIKSSLAKASEDKQIPSDLPPTIHKKQQQNEWVETKARAGNFGTPVFFKDEFESAVAEAMADRPENTTENKPDVIENTPENNSEKKEKEQEIVTQQESTPATPEHKQTSIVTQKPETKSTSQKHQPQPAKPLSGPVRRSLGEGGPKPPLTLAQLSQGFLNHVKDEGKHAIHMLGKKSGRPTDEQIKYERYLQKLGWCLQNSFNIHNNRFPPSASAKDDAHVLLALNKDGSLKHCHVSKTSGNRDLDHFITFIFNDASTSFPPVPQYLPHDPFAITYIIMVSNSEESRWRLYRQ